VSFLIDTDVCSAYLRGDRRVFNRFVQHSGGHRISAVSLAELYSWVFRANAPPGRRQGLTDLLSDVLLLDVDHNVAHTFGQVRAALLDQGRPIATPDLLIAATALWHDLTLVTHNVAHFSPIPGLRIEDWLTP
jgi:tRNA(fMet)-specific endonuclease VapC